jgi:hypothetical protein
MAVNGTGGPRVTVKSGITATATDTTTNIHIATGTEQPVEARSLTTGSVISPAPSR